MNILNKQKLKNKKFHISIFDNSENTEIFSTLDTPFDEIIDNIPYTMNFTIYANEKMENIPISFILKEGDNNIGSFEINIDNQKPFYEISDTFPMKNSKISDTSFYLKIILENINDL
jgi:hypothetical protein